MPRLMRKEGLLIIKHPFALFAGLVAALRVLWGGVHGREATLNGYAMFFLLVCVVMA